MAPLPFAILALMVSPMAEPVQHPDVIVTNAKIWTGDAKVSTAEAMTIFRGKIVRVGTTAELKGQAGPNTKVLDMGGRRVVPGVFDSHVHFFGGGRSMGQVDLKDAKDLAEFGKRLKEIDAKTPRGRWLLGGNWDHDRTFGGVLPTAEMVDQFVKDRPVFIRRYDGHMALANTAAMKLAGITPETKNPPGGTIERLKDKKTPQGIFQDNAMDLVEKVIPEPEADEIAEGVKAALTLAAEMGVTSVEDMEGSSTITRQKYLNVLIALAKKGELTCRVNVRAPITHYPELNLEQTRFEGVRDYVQFKGVKGFMDGSLGSRTAKMFDYYVDGNRNKGLYVTEPARMKQMATMVDNVNVNIAIHAIGDEANAKLLDIFEGLQNAGGGMKDKRFRIEHAQHLRLQDIPRFKAIGVVASMQPYHVIDDGRWAETRIDKKLCETSYAYRGLLDAGAVLAFGSDWPVAPLNPWVGIDAAVNRIPIDSKLKDGWYPKQKITVAESLKAYCEGSAYASYREKELGTITEGKMADFVVLDRDILDEKNKDKLADTKVLMTVVGGKVVFERK